LISGAFNKAELSQIKKDLSYLQTLNIDQNVCDEFLKIMTLYSLSHNLNIPDGLIAATAITNEIPLYTLNKKDFIYVKGLKLKN